MDAHIFHSSVLREYDVRGVVDETLTVDDALALGRAFGSLVRRQGGRNVCVGYDGRHSSPDLERALVSGLMDVGVNVDRVGMGPTPMVYFTLKDRMMDGAVMVTGSHNPSSYNGFKMSLQSGPVFGEVIQSLGTIAAQADFYTTDKRGVVRDVDIAGDYIKRLIQDLTVDRSMKIAWDAGHGAVAALLKEFTEALPGDHVLLYDTVDGDFPAHHPDPTVDKNLEDLIKVVREQKCDLGIAFDGDGDRIGVVDEQGNILRCDTLMTLYAASVLEALPGAPIIGDIKCSGVMFNEVRRLGGEPIMWKTGHSLIKSKMAELKSPLAGELSGHIFFADKYYGFDDALYCAVRLLNELSDHPDQGLSALTAHLPSLVNTPEIRLEVDEEKKFSIVETLKQSLLSLSDSDVQVNDIDGIRVDNGPNWWLLRPSNTQNALVIRIEAEDDKKMQELVQQLSGLLKAANLDNQLQEALS